MTQLFHGLTFCPAVEIFALRKFRRRAKRLGDGTGGRGACFTTFVPPALRGRVLAARELPPYFRSAKISTRRQIQRNNSLSFAASLVGN